MVLFVLEVVTFDADTRVTISSTPAAAAPAAPRSFGTSAASYCRSHAEHLRGLQPHRQAEEWPRRDE